jgi:hypothetical protein
VKAQEVAAEMKRFLNFTLPNVLVWFSAQDISAGARWSLQITSELTAADFGVILITRESLTSEWLTFEAGTLAKSVDESKLCPYLIDIDMTELRGPLAQFQAKLSDARGTRDLLESVNRLNLDEALSETQLSGYFDAFWPPFDQRLRGINEDRPALPFDIRIALLELLPPIFYHPAKIEMLGLFAGIRIWHVNFQQAAVHVWRELIQVAADEKRLGNLVVCVMQDAPALAERIAGIHERLGPWTTPAD